jgi:hypothetical protein
MLALLAIALPGVASGTRSDNGVSSMTPAQILAKVKQDVAGAKSVHVYGAGTSGGQKLSIDFKLVKGKGGGGPFAASGLSFDVIRIGNLAYFRGDKKFWSNFTKSPDLAGLFAGKWIKVSATSGDFASLTDLTDIKKLTDALLSSHGTLKVGKTTKINGHPAIAIVDTSNGGTLYVATTGPAYPLAVKPGPKEGPGQITFSDWNKSVTVKAPAKSLDFRKLNG